MSKRFDYSTQARKLAFRFPGLSHIAIQVIFWIVAFLLLAAIIHLSSLSLIESYSLKIDKSFTPAALMSIVVGIIYGTSLGMIDIVIDKGFLRRLSLGLIILLRSIAYLCVLICIIVMARYILWEQFIRPQFYQQSMHLINHLSWKYIFLILLIYTTGMSAVISFINQMNQKFGPGMLLPILFGRYRNPKEEERIFMFMDLKSSTTHAEKLGHIKYSSLIRDSFMDINQVLARHHAEVYQYVGDEIVVNWLVGEGLRGLACVEFFFSAQEQFNQRHDYYIENYGFVPQFKAGLHLGIVTAVEVGEIKREIAYHGDTLNTAARIQSICNQYEKSFLISKDVKTISDLEKNFSLEALGNITLKGKDNPVEIFSIESRKFIDPEIIN